MNDYYLHLDQYLKQIPYLEYFQKIKQLAEYCDVSEAILYNWRTGRTYLKKSDRDLIESFFQEKIF